ncbi:MAG: hypothetical protein AUI58_07470 [Chloroflexi bacterium 13_1_40CM_2_70_6]|nr:MAG: hypothetical protein AUH44_02315 [Chloroflexi bacterium 13_1_40CM_68_15]OLD51457.1 MAG: hypothetical protein AUI58_07470 [Chloroflexi bacterium 13_1_40CM_2_70_6]TMG37784.1 MAG: hypothetical protein E6H94_06955 [Chloroflexota bacterium]TMG38865.1 MAG: hypothetical protein E6H88_03565 [Chloroflexota bacterium]
MPFDPAHFVERFFSPFNSESRFYWPAVVAVGVALVANILWYNWRVRLAPAENALKPWAFWINVVFLIWLLVLLIAKTPFWIFTLSVVVNIAALAYMYLFYLPPQEAAWEREQRRRAYFPKPERRRKRRRR